MEKTHKYTTLKGLLKAMSKYSQFNLNTFLSGRMNHKLNGWVKYKITPELKEEIERLFKSVIGDLNLNIYCSYGIFDRLIIGLRQNKPYSQYIAGQEYPSELRYLRKLIKKEVL